MKKKLICIIPARKGSKRIKNKNFKDFCGRPIIYHTILNLKKLKIFNNIFVSTNSTKVSRISRELGAIVLKRSEKLSDDYTDTKTVIFDAIKKIDNLNYKFDKVCCVYPTSIFFNSNKFKLAIKLLKKDIPYVFSAKEYDHPIFRSFFLNNKNLLTKNFKNEMGKKTQNFKKTYHDGAQFYLGWKNSWKKKIDIFNKNSKIVIFSKLESIDIDNKSDWEIAEKLWKIRNK